MRISDRNGSSVPGATASYLLFNYAEFYPLARLVSDSNGESSLVTGYGSLLIWADNGTEFGFSLAQPEDTVVNVTLTSEIPSGSEPVDLRVPEIPEPYPGIDSALAQMNNNLNRMGDSIRNAYISSWMTGISADEIAGEVGLPSGIVEGILKTSMGNYRGIIEFIRKSGENAGLAMRILQNISDKDLRDTPSDILDDHLVNAPQPAPGSDTSLYDMYVLSPRISNELLSPFRSAFKSLPGDLMDSFRSDPAAAVAWTDSEITVSPGENHYSVPLTPAGVLRLRMADSHSRDIFLVALCRSAGIPSRLAPGTGRPQYHSGGEWHDVWFSGEKKPSGTPGYISFVNGDAGQEPEYHVHFTLAHLENGRFNTLDYGYGVKISELNDRLALDPGTYMLTTGNRDEFGNVMASVSFYELKAGQDLTVVVTLRRLPESGLTGEKVSLEKQVVQYSGEKTSLDSLAEKGLVMIWMEPGREPTRHILNDLPGLKDEFDKWGGWFVFLTDPARNPEGFNPESVAGIPENTVFAADSNLELMTSLLGSGSSSRPLPVVLCCNSKGEILFSSEGYRIGTGQQILKKIRQ
ncbi:transglutaminase domain-containing protein [bacterium]|nr:transglutaminase domain-containing protein [bacterium]